MVARVSESDVQFQTKDALESTAERLLRDHSIVAPPIDPVHIAEERGLRVFGARFVEAGVNGMLENVDGAQRILVNVDDSPNRQRFTIAHELAHHILGHPGQDTMREVDLFRTSDQEDFRSDEYQANYLGAAILMPRHIMLEAAKRTRDVEVLSALFGVSKDAIRIRLSGLGF